MTNELKKSLLWRWITHPAVGLIGTVASIISIPLAFWFYVKTVPSRELAVVEPPIRSVFLNRDAPATLEVRLNGAQVQRKDVFAVQLAIWNRGNQSIRPENVLETVVFAPEEGTEVVDVTVLRKTRDVCGIAAETKPDHRGAQVTWKILEPGDGAILQLVLAGDQKCRVAGQGTVEGGGRPHYVQVGVRKSSDSVQLWSNTQDLMSLFIAVAFFVFLGWGTVILLFKDLPKAMRQAGWRRLRKVTGVLVLAMFTGAFSVVVGLYILDCMYNAYRVPNALLVSHES